ncbi:MAG: rhomboid family intramembrane serine protease, partial [Chromatocurvus sp.]
SMGDLLAALRPVPVTAGLLLLSVAGFFLVYLNMPLDWVSGLTYLPFSIGRTGPSFAAMNGEYWRLVTPVFLHFSWLHIVFNALWTWEFGHRIENTLGSRWLLLLFFATAVISNTSQFLAGGPSIFGGMSGVVYGLLGFSWVAARLQPRWQFAPPPGLMLFMIGWLLICLFGVIE